MMIAAGLDVDAGDADDTTETGPGPSVAWRTAMSRGIFAVPNANIEKARTRRMFAACIMSAAKTRGIGFVTHSIKIATLAQR